MLMTAITALLYLLATGVLVRGVAQGRDRNGWLALAALALVFHAELHAEAWRRGAGPDMHFFAALSLVSLGMAALTTLMGARGRTDAIGVVVLPIAAVLALSYTLAGHPSPKPMSWQLQSHAWLALLSYATLGVAALLAILLWLQERAMRNRQFHGWMRALPPLTELESVLFRTLWVGFLLLTGSLLMGMVFVENMFEQHIVHKTVLSIVSWIVFAALLFGRWKWGWRGTKAVRLTLVAMALLLLAVFGSQFVKELILQRV